METSTNYRQKPEPGPARLFRNARLAFPDFIIEGALAVENGRISGNVPAGGRTAEDDAGGGNVTVNKLFAEAFALRVV